MYDLAWVNMNTAKVQSNINKWWFFCRMVIPEIDLLID